MNGSALTLGFAAGLAALAAARPEGRGHLRGSRANDAGEPARIRLRGRWGRIGGGPRPNETRETAEKRFFDALESVAGKGQVLYIGPFVMVGDRTGGVYGNLEIGVSAMENGIWGVHLGFIGVPKEARRTGRGSKLLSIVTAAADAAGLPMDLDVDPTTMRGDAKAPVSKKDLRAWYGKFGFKSVKRLGVDYMVRPAGTGALALSGLAARRGSRATGVDRVQVRALYDRFETWKRRVIRAAGDDPDETEFDPNVHVWGRDHALPDDYVTLPDGRAVRAWIAELERTLGARILGIGAGRVAVLVTPGTVAKLPWNAGGVEQNQGEIASWDEADEDVRAWMLPPIDFVFPPGISIFPLASVGSPAFFASIGAAKKAWAHLVHVGAAGANTGDAIKTENWGEYEGRLVLLDYAPDNE